MLLRFTASALPRAMPPAVFADRTSAGHDPGGSAEMQAARQHFANIRCLRAVLTELRTRSGPDDGASR